MTIDYIDYLTEIAKKSSKKKPKMAKRFKVNIKNNKEIRNEKNAGR